MGLAGLTAVFGMGTGVTPPVWSPEKCPAGGQARPGTVDSVGRSHTNAWQSCYDHISEPNLTRITVRSLVLPLGAGAASGSGWSSDRLLVPVS